VWYDTLMIKYYFRTVQDASLKQISELRNGVWIHAENPTRAELEDLSEQLDLDMNIVEDSLDFFEVPRLEKVGEVSYFFTRYPHQDKNKESDTAPLLIVTGEAFVLTVALTKVPRLETLLEGKIEFFTTQKTKLFIQVMESVTSSFERELIQLRRAVNKDRSKIRRISNREVEHFVNFEHKLNEMVSAVVPTNVSLQKVATGSYVQIFPEDKELIDDVRIANEQVVESARTLLKTIQNLRSASEAILAINLNSRIKTLTVLTILLTIPMVIASLYGMNVALPFAANPNAFMIVVGVVVVAVGVMVWYFRRNDWL